MTSDPNFGKGTYIPRAGDNGGKTDGGIETPAENAPANPATNPSGPTTERREAEQSERMNEQSEKPAPPVERSRRQ